MECPVCCAEARSVRREHHYDEGGLVVTLVDVEFLECDSCGEAGPIIRDLEGLHRAIVEAIVRKPGALAGVEIRFLRTFLGWSGRELAQKLNRTPETVSRWENGQREISPNDDALLRWFATSEVPVEDYKPQDAVELRRRTPLPGRMCLRLSSAWRESAARG